MLELLPSLSPDPILGLTMAYKSDNNPQKVDLGAGIYKDESGQTPIMAAVKEAQVQWLNQETTKAYAPPAGFPGFNEGISRLILGHTHPALKEERVISVQTPGGCGALRVAAGMLARCRDNIKVWVSTPTWANHIPLLGSAGLELVEYPYYDYAQHSINFDAMMSALDAVQAGDFVLLHGCCHNPSGADLTLEQWKVLTALLVEKGAVPFIDIAYQGLGDGLDEDAQGLRYVTEHCPETVIASSCSKNFGLYRERVGAVLVVASNTNIAETCKGQLLNVSREIYSMPPSYGAALVDIILHSQQLTEIWQKELTENRQRIQTLRNTFASQLNAAGFGNRFDFIQREKGMFSFLGISKEQVNSLKENDSIYMVGSSRINIAGLNNSNMDYVINCLTNVL